jgi:hypothetical protein
LKAQKCKDLEDLPVLLSTQINIIFKNRDSIFFFH